MKSKTLFMSMFIVLFTCMFAYADGDKNPFTGQSIKENTPTATSKTASKVIPVPSGKMQIPPPPIMFQQPLMPQQGVYNNQQQALNISPEERFEIDGIVNDTVIIKDRKNPDLLIHKNDFDVLPNGCVVKYPQILCGSDAAKALKTFSDKSSIATRYMELTKEYGVVKQQNETLIAKNAEYEKLKQDSVKIKQYIDEVKKLTDNTNILTKQIADLKAEKSDSVKRIEALKDEVKKTELFSKETIIDLNSLVNLLYSSPQNIDYNVPKVGKFKGVLSGELFYAFVPLSQKDKADSYFKKYNKSAYKTESFVMYINNKKFLED